MPHIVLGTLCYFVNWLFLLVHFLLTTFLIEQVTILIWCFREYKYSVTNLYGLDVCSECTSLPPPITDAFKWTWHCSWENIWPLNKQSWFSSAIEVPVNIQDFFQGERS